MAAINRNANPAVTSGPDLGSQVEARIASVNSAYDKAIAALSGGIFGQSDAEKNATYNVAQFRDDVDEWAARGRDAVRSGKQPGAKGWSGWVDRGNVYIEGFKAQAEFDHATLTAIVEIVKETPAQVVKATKAAAKAAGGVVVDVASGAGKSIAAGLLMPIGIAIGAYIVLRVVAR